MQHSCQQFKAWVGIKAIVAPQSWVPVAFKTPYWCYKISLLRTNDMIIAPMKQPFHNFLLITCKSSSLSTPCNPSSTLMTVLITRFPSSHLDLECLMTMAIPLDSWLMTVRYRFRNIALLSANNSLHNKSSSIIQGHRAHGIPTKHL